MQQLKESGKNSNGSVLLASWGACHAWCVWFCLQPSNYGSSACKIGCTFWLAQLRKEKLGQVWSPWSLLHLDKIASRWFHWNPSLKYTLFFLNGECVIPRSMCLLIARNVGSLEQTCPLLLSVFCALRSSTNIGTALLSMTRRVWPVVPGAKWVRVRQASNCSTEHRKELLLDEQRRYGYTKPKHRGYSYDCF